MRDNLFRGRLTERFADAPKMRPDLVERGIIKGGFVYGSLVADDKRCFICIAAFAGNQSYVNNAYATMFEVDPETVGQYTGLTDKNGVKIFEGDIIEGHCHSRWNHELKKCVIAYDKDHFEARHYINNADNDYYTYKTLFSKDVVVIGNIYDSPELLEGGEINA